MVVHGSDPVPTWSVAELHEALNGLLVHVFGEEVWIEGEMRNLNRSAKGHVYFDLVDAGRDGDPTRPRGQRARARRPPISPVDQF